jgi:hypothetical protein
MPTPDVAWALDQFRDSGRATRTRVSRDYYRGDHPLLFATERFREVFRDKFGAVIDNLCPAVIESVADRLEVTGFTASGLEDPEQADGIAKYAWSVWQRNRMDLRAPETHREALITGDGFAIVWPGADGRATIWPQTSEDMAVEYDPQEPDRIIRAAKLWTIPTETGQKRRMRVTIYLPDRIERYVTERTVAYDRPGQRTRMTQFVPYASTEAAAASATTEAIVPNPFGRVPVFHFPNRAVGRYGVGELLDVIPLQDALNKTLCDQMIASEFGSYIQRILLGYEVEVDERTNMPKAPELPDGADKWVAIRDPNVKVETIPQTDITMFLEAEENLRAEIARVSGTPLHYLFITKGDYPSGEAMKSAEARFTRKLRERMTSFGNVWEDALAFALRIDERPLPEGVQLATQWTDPAPRASSKEIADLMPALKEAGVPFEWTWKHILGVSEEEARTFRQRLEAAGVPGTPPAAASDSGTVAD